MSKPRLLALFALLPLLLTCRMESLFVGPSSAALGQLPADTIQDVSRSFSGPFQYETLLPVELSLTVALYRQSQVSAGLEPLPVANQLVFVTLENRQGQRLYTGTVPSDGTLNTVLSLPAAPEDVVLTLEAPGFETRWVTIDSMVLRSRVSRVMGLLAKEGAAKGEILPDRDNDGVPDIYDAYPDDPDIAFTVRNPAAGSLTVAFEDLYPVPGDADYNDFVAEYFLIENHKSVVKDPQAAEQEKDPVQIGLTSLHGEATAKAKIAGYNHKFGILLEFPGRTATTVERVYYDAAGNRRTEVRSDVADKVVIWLFENTKYAVGNTATFDLSFPKGIPRDDLSPAPYDPVLLVLNTGKDIHLVGRDPLSGPVPGQTYLDPNGYPWGLLVPDDWQHPAETQYIGKAYPLFDDWRKSKGADFAYWYLYPASTSAVPGNNPPYPVTAPTGSPVLIAGASQPQTWDLSYTDPQGDPDGDLVEFMNSPVPAALANYFSLDAKTGTVTFKPGVPAGSYLVYFWSQDEHGATTLSKPFKATFTFEAKAANQPPSVTFAVPPITGSTALGGTLTAAYNYSDPEGDPEGASTFQWYRFATSAAVTGGTAIAGATVKNYTTVDLTGNSDSGQWLRVQVTPVDARGAAGTPVLSGPVPVNRRVVIDTFLPTGFFQNDTFLTLVNAAGSVIAQDDNGNPDQKNHQFCSRIDQQSGLSSGTYYIKVHKPTDVGSQFYCIRLLDTNPGAVFPATAPVVEASDSDDAVGAAGLPLNPVAIALGQVLSRMIEPELSDNDWFTFTIP